MRWIFFLLLLTPLLFAANQSFSKSKKELRKIYSDYQITLYCDCKYSYKDKSNMIDKESCGYKPRQPYTKKGKVNERVNRIEWEHLIPAENFGREFSCWRDGDEKCVDSRGKSFKGRKCCEKVDEKYRIMQADMHNLFPTIGELNGDRNNFKYDFELASSTQYGQCQFNVNLQEKRARVQENIRGVIARTYLYFVQEYKMQISKQERQKYEAWHKKYPADNWEVERNRRIVQVQGNLNHYIQK